MPCSPERSPGCLRRACTCLHSRSRPAVGLAGPDVCLWGRTETGTRRGFALLFSLCGRVTGCRGCSGLCPFHYRIFHPLPRFFFESERASECAYRSGGGGPLLSAPLPLTPECCVSPGPRRLLQGPVPPPGVRPQSSRSPGGTKHPLPGPAGGHLSPLPSAEAPLLRPGFSANVALPKA